MLGLQTQMFLHFDNNQILRWDRRSLHNWNSNTPTRKSFWKYILREGIILMTLRREPTLHTDIIPPSYILTE